jgi:UDP-glucose 4-epimerase
LLTHLTDQPKLSARTVVIGAGGFVGGAIARLVAASGGQVLPLSRQELDLMAPDAAPRLAALLKPGDAVVAAAAKAPCKDMSMMIDNMIMVRAMIDGMRHTHISHLVNISSDAVYADGPVPLSEASPTAPTSMHGAMHLAREIAFAMEGKAPIATLRPTLIYGPGDPHNGYGPNRFRRLADANEDIVLFGEGEEQRDHIFIDDVAAVALSVLSHRSRGVVNVVTGTIHSFRSLAEQVVAIAPNKVRISGRPRQGPMPHNGYRPFDVAGLRGAFPDLVLTPIETGLAKAQSEGGR